MTFTPAQWHAACHIQRIFRGAHSRANKLPLLRKYQPSNGIRLRFTQHPAHYYNTLDPYWASPIESADTQSKVEFFPTRIALFDNGDSKLEKFALKDECETARWAFAQIINASFEKRPIYRYITPENSADLKAHFDAEIEKISAGESVRVWDGKSTQINPHSRSILDKAYDGFLYYAGYPPVPGREKYTETLDSIDKIERHMEELLAMPVGPCCTRPIPKLPRQGSTRIAGVRVDLSKARNPPQDDLEERFQRLLAHNK